MNLIETLFLKLSTVLANKKITFAVVILLFFASLFVPAFYTENRCPGFSPEPAGVYYGWFVLLWGWAGVLTWTIGWYANIGLGISIALYIIDSHRCFKYTLISFLIALSSLGYKMAFHDGGGWTEYVSHLGIGFYLWLSSFMVLLLAQMIKEHTQDHSIQ